MQAIINIANRREACKLAVVDMRKRSLELEAESGDPSSDNEKMAESNAIWAAADTLAEAIVIGCDQAVIEPEKCRIIMEYINAKN